MVRMLNADVQIILEVLHHARKHGLCPNAAAREAITQRRRAMRTWRQRARGKNNLWREAALRRVRSLQADNRRIRRLIKQYRSWQAA